jgi:hypothetical protein
VAHDELREGAAVGALEDREDEFGVGGDGA